MPINPFTDEILSFGQLARRLTRLRDDRPVSPRTPYRWATEGLCGVKLETTYQGGVRVTSVAAVERFFQAVAQARARKADLAPCAAASA
jgi:hypothetical protein